MIGLVSVARLGAQQHQVYTATLLKTSVLGRHVQFRMALLPTKGHAVAEVQDALLTLVSFVMLLSVVDHVGRTNWASMDIQRPPVEHAVMLPEE